MTEKRQRGSNITRIETASGPRWRFRVDVPPAEDGARRQRTMTFKSEREAIEAQAKHRVQVSEGSYLEPSRLTVNDWFDAWLSTGERTWRASTSASYRLAFKPAREAFGTMKLQKLRREHVEALTRSMLASGGRTGTGRSPRTVSLLLTVLSKCLGDALDDELVTTNAAARVKKPARAHTEMSTWTAEQMRTFLNAVDDDPLVGAWNLSALGLRRGEVLGLRWSDVDFEKGVINIRQARVQAGKEVVVNEPKTSRGRRTLPLHPALVTALRTTQRRTVTDAAVLPLRQRGAGARDRLIVVDAAGEPLRPDRYSELFEKHARDAGLPLVRLHDLRHSALSLLLAQGVPVHVVAKIAGHDPSVTLRTYAHAQDAAMVDAVTRLGELYGTR